jgi:hypothetical protein
MTEQAWSEVVCFYGSTRKNTETFEVAALWRITWNGHGDQNGGGYLEINVHRASGKLKEAATFCSGPSADHTIMRGAGQYYLKIDASMPYEIKIEEFR